MENRSFARREVLKSGGLLIGASAVTSLAGCLNVPGVEGNGTHTSYTDWIYNPEQILDRESDIGGETLFNFWRMTDIIDNTNYFNNEAYNSLERLISEYSNPFGVNTDQLETTLFTLSDYGESLGLVVVFTGSFDSESAGSAIEAEFQAGGLGTSDNEYEDYTIYVSGDGGAAGVSDDALIFSFPSEGVETTIDTKQGTVDRYIEMNDDFALLTDHLGGNTIDFGILSADDRRGRTDEPLRNLPAIGITWTVRDETSDFDVAAVYKDADDIDLNSIMMELEESNEFVTNIDDVDARTDGRTAIISGTTETSEVEQLILL